MSSLRFTRYLMFLMVAALSGFVPASVAAQGIGQLYAAVTGPDGEPVLDLAASDFGLTIDDTPLTVVSADVDSTPMKIALMVDNGNSIAEANADNSLRDGLQAFVDTLAAQHEVGVFTIARNVQRRVDFTADRAELNEAVGEIFADSGAGARMMDGLFETWERRFEPEDSWPVFVMVLTDGSELSGYISDEEYGDFVNDLIRRGATLHAVMFSRQGANSATGGVQAQYALNLTENTGGLYRGVNAATGLPDVLEEFATLLNSHFDAVSTRYRIVYEVPDDVGGGGISVRMSRGNLNLQLFADRRLPDQ